MMITNILRKLVSLILIIVLVIGIIPYSTLEVFAAGPVVVNEISITKKFYTLENPSIYYLTIRGENLLSASVTYIDKEGKLTSLGSPVPASNDSIVQYEVDPEFIGTEIIIESKTYYIGEENMPMLDNITPTSVKKNVDLLTITGTNFDNVDTVDADSNGIPEDSNGDGKIVTALYYQGENSIPIFDQFGGSPNEAKFTVDNALGLQNVRFDRMHTVNNGTNDVDITITYRYIDVFRIYDDLEISDDITMYPNRGEKGSRVYFKAEILKQDMSVFFLTKNDGTETYKQENKGLNTTYKKDFELSSGIHYDQFSVEVPSTLEIGQEYYIVFTNKVEDSMDPERVITKEKLLANQKFTVISRDDNVQIYNIEPDQGPDTGQSVEINGKYFGTINIKDLNIDAAQPGFPAITNNTNDLVLDYGTGTYNGKNVKDIKKTIKVFIASDATFENSKNDLTNFTTHSDTVFVQTPSLTLYDDTRREDVIVTTVTTFTEDGTGVIYRFEEREEFDGFTFIPSRITPTIDEINPSKIMVKEKSVADGTFEVTEDIYLAIHGKNFLIHSYKDEFNDQHTRYPVINIEDELIIDKNNDTIEDHDGVSNEPVELIVLNDEGRVLDGSVGNEIGSKIIVKIPKGKVISDTIVSTGYVIKDIKLRVTNPIRNTLNMEPWDEGTVNFIEVDEENAPKITTVEPYIVTINGNEEITVLGSNFHNGIKVYIDGEEVSGVQREGNGKELRFTCPPGREGITQLLVMNDDGGIAVHDFIYVKTYTDPEVTSISPEKGMAGTLVIIDGDNFLQPDPTATSLTEMGMYKLLGTRVLFDGVDLNRYNRDPATDKIILKDYVAPDAASQLITIDNGQPKIADYYYSILLQEEDGVGALIDNFYTITLQNGQPPILSDGVDNTYSILVEGGNLKIKKDSEPSQDLTVTNSHIEFVGGTKLRIRTPYEIAQDSGGNDIIIGNRVKVKGKKQVYVTVPILAGEGWYDVTVVNPDIKKVEINNGFYYSESPMNKPVITSIVPSEGSVNGGYDIEIIGTDFEYKEKSPTEIIQSKVIIDGIEVPQANITVWSTGDRITVTMPPYPIDIKEELGLDRLTVPVVVLNSDGGSDSKEDGFTYVTPTSHPEIWNIHEIDKGTVGERYLQIIGDDFRYYEPFEDKNGNAKYDSAVSANETYTDVNGNSQYDDYSDRLDPTILNPGETLNDLLAVLPKVYIGENVAEIVEFQKGYILIKIPTDLRENADVYLTNNDHGVSNTMKYTYVPKFPKIDRIDPSIGTKKGKTYMEIHGENFNKSTLDIYEDDGSGTLIVTQKDMVLVRFDEISEQEDIMISRTTEVDLDGGLKVKYNGQTQQLTVTIEEKVSGVDKEYERVFDFSHAGSEILRYIDMSSLQDKSDPNVYYSGYELIKVEVNDKDKTILVERGYSPSTDLIRAGQLQVWSPSYYTISPTGVTVTLINPDGNKATASQRFQYTNPIVDLKMTDITDVIEKKEVTEGSNNYYIIESTVDGGLTFTIEGTGFQQPLTVKIGGQEAEILPNGVSSNKIRVRSKSMPNNVNVNIPLLITVEVDGVGSVTSADPTLSKPIYYVYRDIGGSQPVITEVTPNKGSVAGGDIITIKGNNFAVNHSLSNVIVKIGDKVATVRSGSTINELLVTLPSSSVLGPVDVYVKNIEPLGETSLKNGFTYCSNPTIFHVSPDLIHTTGGEKVTILGTMFMEGVKVTINDEPVQEINRISENEIEIVTPPMEKDGYHILRVENTDGGSATYSVRYILPYPDTPTGLQAVPGNERSVILKWNDSGRADRYKIFAAKAVEDKKYYFNYKEEDFFFLGETSDTEYHIKDLEVGTKYFFRLWAVNDFGESPSYVWTYTTTLSASEDQGDDKYKEEKITKTTINETEGRMSIILPDFYTQDQYTIDLRQSEYNEYGNIDITLPLAVARRVSGNITIKTEFVNAEISLHNISNSVWYKGNDLEDTNVKIVINRLSKSEKSRITKNLSRKEEAVSEGYSIEFIFQQRKTEEIFHLKNGMDLSLLIDKGDLNSDNLCIYRYSPEENKLEEQYSTSKTFFDYKLVKHMHKVNSSVSKSGKYIIVKKK